MNHLQTAYKLGALAAVDNFTAWLQNDDGNPTDYPKRRGAILKTAVVQGNQVQPLPTQPPPATGSPVGAPAPSPAPAPPPAQGAETLSRLGGGSGGGGGGGLGGGLGAGRTSFASWVKQAAPPPPKPQQQQQQQQQSQSQRQFITGGATSQAKSLHKSEGHEAPLGFLKQHAYNPTLNADRAVDYVMRKLGKSMSRRPLSRDGTKYEALKRKLRKQKPKKD